MDTLNTVAHDVARIARQFGFKDHGSKVLAVTFSGRRAGSPVRETFVVNNPTQGWVKKDGSVTISNAYACWGWHGSKKDSVNVSEFLPETIKTADGKIHVWGLTV